MYETNKNMMKRIILFGLTALLLAACSTDDVDDFNNIEMSSNQGDISYEGIWSIDDEPVEQYYTVAYGQDESGTVMIVSFPTFPYQALADQILRDINIAEIPEQTKDFQMRVSMVGNSVTCSYYDVSEVKTHEASGTYLTFDVVTKEARKVTVKLGLQTDECIFSFSDNAASCVLVVECAELTYEDGEHKTLVVDPVRKMTFVSTKRTR